MFSSRNCDEPVERLHQKQQSNKTTKVHDQNGDGRRQKHPCNGFGVKLATENLPRRISTHPSAKQQRAGSGQVSRTIAGWRERHPVRQHLFSHVK